MRVRFSMPDTFHSRTYWPLPDLLARLGMGKALREFDEKAVNGARGEVLNSQRFEGQSMGDIGLTKLV